MTQKTNHLPIDTLADYVAGRLSEADVRRLEAHLAIACPTCQDNLTWLRETLALMASSDWVSPQKESVAAIQQAGRWQDWTHKSLEPPAQLVATVKQAARRPNSLSQSFEPSAESVDAVKQAAREYNRRVGQRPVPRPKKRYQRLFTRQLRWATAVAAVLALFIVGGLLYQYQQQDFGEQKATLTEINGNKILVQPESQFIPTTADRPLKAGELIHAPDGSVTVHFFDDSTATLEPKSTLSITELSPQENDKSQIISLEQLLGQIAYHVEPNAYAESRFEISTLTPAVTRAQGTDFTVDVAPDDTTTWTVAEGRITITAQGQTITASAGQTITIPAGEAPPIQSGTWYGHVEGGEGCISFEVADSSAVVDLFFRLPDQLACPGAIADDPILDNQFRITACMIEGTFTSSTTASGTWSNGTWSASPSSEKCDVP